MSEDRDDHLYTVGILIIAIALMMFIENKIYCCLRTLYANAVGDDTEAMRLNTLDLNSNFTYEELERFIHGKELWRMCDYCDFPMKVIAPAEQL